MNCKNMSREFTSKIQTYLSSDTINLVFTHGRVMCLEINGEFVYLWLDPKGNVCYSFNLYDRDYCTASSLTKLGNALTRHFDSTVEVLNNRSEFLKKAISATTGLNKTISEAQSYHDYSGYSQRGCSGQDSAAFDLIPNMDQNLPSHQALAHQQEHLPQKRFNQKQLYSDIIDLSAYQLQSVQNTFFIYANELPIVHKELFRPNSKCAFFIEKGLTIKNKYIPSEYLIKYGSPYNLSGSFIISFIFAMAKNDIVEVMKILVWLVNCINTLCKLPYALVLHSENDVFIQLFYEEIVTYLFNDKHCEKITCEALNEKSLSQLLDEKIIYNFHNFTTPTVLNNSAKEFTNRLIHKDDYKLNHKVVTTVGNVLITSTSRYIPLIAKDVPCLVVSVESTLDFFCKEKNIDTNYHEVFQYIKNDLDNFVSIVRNIDICKLNVPWSLKFYKDEDNTDIIDGDVDLLAVFETFIKKKDIVSFVLLKTKVPKLYKILIDDFAKNRVNRKNLIEYFTILFGENIYKKNQNRKLIEDLRSLSQTNEPFDSSNVCNIRGNVYYYL